MSDKELDGGEAAAMYALELRKAQTRIAELEEERVELQDALDEIATLLSCPPEYDREHLYIDAVAARDIAIKAIDGGPIDEAPGKDGEV